MATFRVNVIRNIKAFNEPIERYYPDIAWSKYLALFIGNTGYSNMIVLVTYMGGLAPGAFSWGKYSDVIGK